MSGEFTHYDWSVAAPSKEHKLWQPALQCHRHDTNTYWAVSPRGLGCH